MAAAGRAAAGRGTARSADTAVWTRNRAQRNQNIPRDGRGRKSAAVGAGPLINPAAANLDNPIALEPIGNGQFRYVAPTGGGPVGEIVRFVEENGRITRMITGDSFVERVQQ